MDDETERRWIDRARAGDEDAFRMLMDLHRDRAYGIAVRITRSRQDAEDVVQLAFVRVWFALERFRGEARFGTWLHRIVARCALDRATQLKVWRAREDELEPSTVSVAMTGRDGILIRRLEALMRQLTAPQRAVVTLYYWESMPVEEIGGVLGMPENTVKTHLSRARAALRQAWLKRDARR